MAFEGIGRCKVSTYIVFLKHWISLLAVHIDVTCVDGTQTQSVEARSLSPSSVKRGLSSNNN